MEKNKTKPNGQHELLEPWAFGDLGGGGSQDPCLGCPLKGGAVKLSPGVWLDLDSLAREVRMSRRGGHEQMALKER